MDKNSEPMTNEMYVEVKGTLCPFCRCKGLEAHGGIDVDGETAWLDIFCPNCGKEYQDIYTLTGYIAEKDA